MNWHTHNDLDNYGSYDNFDTYTELMTERASNFLAQVWEKRNNGADTEALLVAAILELAAESVKSYNAQNNLQVLDKQDLLNLAHELHEISS